MTLDVDDNNVHATQCRKLTCDGMNVKPVSSIRGGVRIEPYRYIYIRYIITVPVYYTIKPSSAYCYMGLLFAGAVPGKFYVFTLFFCITSHSVFKSRPRVYCI